MILKCLPTGMFASNCYIVGNNGEGIIIDPGADSTEITDTVEKTGLTIKYIVLTHAHIDHMCSMDEIREKLEARVVAHESDAPAFTDPELNVSIYAGEGRTFKAADIFVKAGDVIEAGGLKFEIIHTPGHTPGGICIKTGNTVFTGDTLFKMSVGRTDLGGGDMGDLIDSIRNRLMTLPNGTVVYPGHGEPTTIGAERRSNLFT